MKCKNCSNLEKVKDYARSDVYDWCVVKHYNPDTDMALDCPFYKPTTNYDRIVSKSLEGLAVWISETIDCGVCEEMHGFRMCDAAPDKACEDCWAGWLRQEAGEK